MQTQVHTLPVGGLAQHPPAGHVIVFLQDIADAHHRARQHLLRHAINPDTGQHQVRDLSLRGLVIQTFPPGESASAIKRWIRERYPDGTYILTLNGLMVLDTGRSGHRVSIERVTRAIQHTNRELNRQ